MKPYQILMALALVGAAALLVFGDSSPDGGIAEAVQRPRALSAAGASSAPAGSVSQAAAPQSTAAVPEAAVPVAGSTAGSAAGVARASKAQPGAAILRLIPRAALVGEAGEATFAAGEGVFHGQNWNPPPPPPPPVSNAPPPPPMAPPVPFTVIGKALADGVWEVYLARGDKTYVARPQSTIDGSYRVEKITPPTMSMTYLPLNQVQQMNIGALD
ncbi:hypothetical protein [Duganella fentianensis]|uniref:hypothetical protein n=1 Tax=Duganella fentianensis TaxID=2692177 RepID=UPI0032B1F9BB